MTIVVGYLLAAAITVAGVWAVAGRNFVAIASYGLVANQLHRSGFGPGRVVTAIAMFSTAATIIYGLVVGMLGFRSDQATLDLIVVGFAFGAVAFGVLISLNVLASYQGPARFLARTGSYLVIGFLQANVLLVGFLLLGVLGLA